MLVKALRLSLVLVLPVASPALAFATPITTDDASASLSDPLEPSPRVDLSVTQRASAPIALDAIAPLGDADPVIHVPSLVPPCDTFSGDDVAASCAFVSWFADEGVRAATVAADELVDRAEAPAVVLPQRRGLLTDPVSLAVMGIGLVAGSLVVRWSVRKRHHRRRSGVGSQRLRAN